MMRSGVEWSKSQRVEESKIGGLPPLELLDASTVSTFGLWLFESGNLMLSGNANCGWDSVLAAVLPKSA